MPTTISDSLFKRSYKVSWGTAWVGNYPLRGEGDGGDNPRRNIDE